MDPRPEIDGLRAIAVVPVILFHAGLGVFPGGYVGVDVFFVISGFLITGLLLDDLDAGRYSLGRFYERRARRILPALLVVVAATLPLAFAVMLPGQFRDLSESVVSVVLFLSNLYFLSQIDYFAPDAALQPLLHTWSLAVEGQFYLVFPPLLAVLWRGGRSRTIWVLAAVALGSLVLADWAGRENAARGFYFTGTRIWELLAGSLAAIVQHGRAVRGRDLPAVAGLAMIVAAMVAFDAGTPVPGLAALLPVLGTVAVLCFATAGTRTARLLSWPPLVAIGLVSYSAYLWHHPLFAAARLYHVAEPPMWVMLGLSALSLVLAALTWRLVEQPFRRRGGPLLPRRGQVLGASVMAIAVLGGIGLAGQRTNGFEPMWRWLYPDAARITDVIAVAQTAHLPQDDGACRFNVEVPDDATFQRVLDCAGQHGPGVAVLGDSHATDLFGIVAGRGDRRFVAGFARPACRPTAAVQDCQYDAVTRFLTAHPDTFAVVLFEVSGAHLLLPASTRLPVQTQMLSLPLDATVPDFVQDTGLVAPVLDYLDDLHAILPVVWIGPRIEPQVQLEWLVGRGCADGLAIRANTMAPFLRLDDQLAQASARLGVAYLSQNRLFDLQFPRDLGGCDGLLWSDGDHYSALGETLMGQRADVVAAAMGALP